MQLELKEPSGSSLFIFQPYGRLVKSEYVVNGLQSPWIKYNKYSFEFINHKIFQTLNDSLFSGVIIFYEASVSLKN